MIYNEFYLTVLFMLHVCHYMIEETRVMAGLSNGYYFCETMEIRRKILVRVMNEVLIF